MSKDLNKRYWVIASYYYYPNHGLDDIRSTWDSLQDAHGEFMSLDRDGSFDRIDLFNSVKKKYLKRIDKDD